MTKQLNLDAATLAKFATTVAQAGKLQAVAAHRKSSVPMPQQQ